MVMEKYFLRRFALASSLNRPRRKMKTMKEMPILPFRDKELQVGGSMLGLSCPIIISVSELHLQLHVPFRMN